MFLRTVPRLLQYIKRSGNAETTAAEMHSWNGHFCLPFRDCYKTKKRPKPPLVRVPMQAREVVANRSETVARPRHDRSRCRNEYFDASAFRAFRIRKINSFLVRLLRYDRIILRKNTPMQHPCDPTKRDSLPPRIDRR